MVHLLVSAAATVQQRPRAKTESGGPGSIPGEGTFIFSSSLRLEKKTKESSGENRGKNSGSKLWDTDSYRSSLTRVHTTIQVYGESYEYKTGFKVNVHSVIMNTSKK